MEKVIFELSVRQKGGRVIAPKVIHQRLSGKLYRELWHYIEEHDGNCEVFFAPLGVRLVEDGKNHLEPDVIVVCDENKIREDGCYGAPDLVIEIISQSTSSGFEGEVGRVEPEGNGGELRLYIQTEGV